MTIQFLMTNNTISVVLNGKPKMVSCEHPNFEKVKSLLLNGEVDPHAFEEILDIRSAVMRTSHGNVRIEGDKVYYKDKVLEGPLVDRLLQAFKSGKQDFLDALLIFSDNLYKNPSFRIKEQLFPFLEKGQNPITSTGGFLAFKKVRENYFDVYSNTIRNAPGDEPSMPREDVDDDPNRTCSKGLHVCNWEYLSHYSGERVVLCLVMPEDVVSVPSDYDNTKMRVSKYKVLQDVTGMDYSSIFRDRPIW